MARLPQPKGAAGVRRRLVMLMWTALLVLLTMQALPAAAAEQIDSLPRINNFSSARFDMLTTVEIGDLRQVAFGSGSTILPDRVSLWIGTDESDQLTYYMQIGTVIYTNNGSGWRRGDDLPPGSSESVTISDQIVMLQSRADAIVDIGDESVRGIATRHYQMWLSGERLLDAIGNTGVLDDETFELIKSSTYKVDLWLGKQDGMLYQQNLVFTVPPHTVEDITIPQLQFTTLITYYSLNDPNVRIEPPI